MMECSNCKRVWAADRFNQGCSTPDWCFACRSKTVSTAFAGGKTYFHDGTEAERARAAISEAKAAGFDPVPVETGKAWSSASASSLKNIGDVSKKAGAFGGKPTEKVVSA